MSVIIILYLILSLKKLNFIYLSLTLVIYIIYLNVYLSIICLNLNVYLFFNYISIYLHMYLYKCLFIYIIYLSKCLFIYLSESVHGHEVTILWHGERARKQRRAPFIRRANIWRWDIISNCWDWEWKIFATNSNFIIPGDWNLMVKTLDILD